MLKKFLLAGLVAIIASFVNVPSARAAILEDAYLTISNPLTAATGVTHTFNFKAAASTVGSLEFQYCIAPSGDCTDSGADGDSAGALVTASITEASAELDECTTPVGTWADVDWTWGVDCNVAEATGAGNAWVVPFSGMGNPVLANCTHATPSNNSTGTCYVKISSYPTVEFAGTPDTTIVSLTVTQAVTVSARVDPVFTFKVEGVAGGAVQDGTTTTTGITTTVTTIPFGNLTANTEKFAAHKLTVTTNTKSGYTISAKLNSNLTGTAYSNAISPFVGSGANQSTPQSWTTPTGTVSGTNTGWLGVGTDDTGVDVASNQFYSLNTTAFTVASSPDSADDRISNVVYGIEVNSFQQADNYTGVMVYNATPTY